MNDTILTFLNVFINQTYSHIVNFSLNSKLNAKKTLIDRELMLMHTMNHPAILMLSQLGLQREYVTKFCNMRVNFKRATLWPFIYLSQQRVCGRYALRERGVRAAKQQRSHYQPD
jgi:hypothetical protein